ncbi:DNA-directed RNA polymerase subunit L [Candidatus Micrarchaeota archaeon]|nr:DNA-directed RNA polymerase subunit L [Candidatus Micrarchaeota archaeon]MBU1165518.1 DNA-directed RNA polymerase subunit L [Candidatus Micrarchaeota archaeon]MBU1887416.1 DNA-directed RNA polymerase subunit L [Candidatus Micrarchaeota archaeon]
MEVNIIVNEKNMLELEFVNGDSSLPQMLVEKLNSDKNVEFAAYKVEHPLIAHPKLILKTKSVDASKLLLEKLQDVKKDVSDFKDQFMSIVK